MIFRRAAAESASETILGEHAALCDVCAVVLPSGTEQCATVLDSSSAHPSSAGVDGERRLVACSTAHVNELVQQYEARPFDEDELLAQIVLRAQRRMCHEAGIEDIAFMTDLTVVQVMRAMRWTTIWMRWLPDGDQPAP